MRERQRPKVFLQSRRVIALYDVRSEKPVTFGTVFYAHEIYRKLENVQMLNDDSCEDE